MMRTHIDLWYTIGGRIRAITDLGQSAFALSTPLHVIDSYAGEELFCNPWGNGSERAIHLALEHAARRSQRAPSPQYDLDVAFAIVGQLQNVLEQELDKARDSELISTFISLKGIPISEVAGAVHASRQFIEDLQRGRLLETMLGCDDARLFFANNDVLARFGLIASGNLGLFETVILLQTAILAQAARNGNQFSLTIKPSIYDFLFHWLIQRISTQARSAFSRVTWRSDEDVLPDARLSDMLVNELDGAIYFGSRSTLKKLWAYRKNEGVNHHLYYDHFPVMIILPDASSETVKSAAQLAVELSYRQRGEACLSLQDIFIHEDHYQEFLTAAQQEWRTLAQATDDLWHPQCQMAHYSTEHLQSIARLRRQLNGAVIGEVDIESHKTDLLINHEINPDNWVLAMENAAPFLSLAPFSDNVNLQNVLQTHLRNSTSDKFIYAILIVGEDSPQVATLSEFLQPVTHRIEILPNSDQIKHFVSYSTDVPHCGGVSFLADIFGIPHLASCYLGGRQPHVKA